LLEVQIEPRVLVGVMVEDEADPFAIAGGGSVHRSGAEARGSVAFRGPTRSNGCAESRARWVGVPLILEFSATIVAKRALRLLSAFTLTACATYSLTSSTHAPVTPRPPVGA
jgi:hypothetical protein